MVVRISDVLAIDKVRSVVSRKLDVLLSQLPEASKATSNYHQEHEN
jgi:hypothetical protein